MAGYDPRIHIDENGIQISSGSKSFDLSISEYVQEEGFCLLGDAETGDRKFENMKIRFLADGNIEWILIDGNYCTYHMIREDEVISTEEQEEISSETIGAKKTIIAIP